MIAKPPHDELSELLLRQGREIGYWTSDADNGLREFWVMDDEQCIFGPFSCTGVAERSDSYSAEEVRVRLAVVERILNRECDSSSQIRRENQGVRVALQALEGAIGADLHRAATKRDFLEGANREGVERLAGMEEAFQIALNRIRTRKPS